MAAGSTTTTASNSSPLASADGQDGDPGVEHGRALAGGGRRHGGPDRLGQRLGPAGRDQDGQLAVADGVRLGGDHGGQPGRQLGRGQPAGARGRRRPRGPTVGGSRPVPMLARTSAATAMISAGVR